MPSLFDILRHPETLTERDLTTLHHFGVKRAIWPLAAAAEAPAAAATQLARCRSAGLAAQFAYAPTPDLLPGGQLETELQRLPHLLSAPRAVALGPCGLSNGARTARGHPQGYQLERLLALAESLRRPVIVAARPAADGREVRRLLGIVRESGIAPARVLGVALPKSALLLFRECGYSVALGLSRSLRAKALVETVSRFGTERVLLVGEGADFLSLPKAVALLEEANVPAQVIRRVAFENGQRFFQPS